MQMESDSMRWICKLSTKKYCRMLSHRKVRKICKWTNCCKYPKLLKCSKCSSWLIWWGYSIKNILERKTLWILVEDEAQLHIASLTANERTKWSYERKNYFSEGVNQESLKVIEESIMLVCFWIHSFWFWIVRKISWAKTKDVWLNLSIFGEVLFSYPGVFRLYLMSLRVLILVHDPDITLVETARQYGSTNL